MQNTSVSVVIPCYNQVSYVEAAIASAYDQSSPPVEVIVVDDGSTDDTAKIAREVGLVVLQLPINLGVGGALRTRKGDFVRFFGPW